MAEVTPIDQPASKLCYICLGDLSTYVPDPDVPVRTCIRCGKHFCIAHVSKMEPQACQECVKDVIVTDTVYERSETDWDEKKDRLVTHTQRCRQIGLSGSDWVWLQKRINSLSDDELKGVIQYHKATVGLIETELTERVVKRSMQQARVPGQPSISVTKTVESKTTKTIKAKQPNLAALAEAIKKLGLTPEQIQQMFGT